MVPKEFELPVTEEVFALLRSLTDGPAKAILEAATTLAKSRVQSVIEAADIHDSLVLLCTALEDGLRLNTVDDDQRTTADESLRFFRGLMSRSGTSRQPPGEISPA